MAAGPVGVGTRGVGLAPDRQGCKYKILMVNLYGSCIRNETGRLHGFGTTQSTTDCASECVNYDTFS